MPSSAKLRVAVPSAPVVAPSTLAPEAGAPLKPSNSSTCTVTLCPFVAVVGPLSQNENGVWQGRATKDGAEVVVAIDYKGAITQP